MKSKTMVLLAIFTGALLFAPRPAPAAVSVSVSFFYDELSPYGRWETVGRWGDCWIPAGRAPGWQPYTDGEWIYTDYGWTWVSYDPWGGDPYHYGTWVWEEPWGWVWVPGTVWAPAWVTWCYSDSYVGWAPIPPNLSISYSGYAGPAVVAVQTHYVFVPVNRFAGVRVSSVRLPVRENAAIFPRVRKLTSFSVSRGVVVNRGPSVSRIERAAHVRIPRRSISEAKSRPTPMSAGGAPHAKKVAVVTSAPVRAREIAERRGGGSEKPAPGREAHAAPDTSRGPAAPSPKREASPPHRAAGSAKHAAPPPGHEAPPAHRESSTRHAAPPPKHEKAPPPKHEKTPPSAHEAPPPAHHEVVARHEAPPPHFEPPPPSHRAATPPAHGAPARPHAAPPKREPPPPPPPGRGKKEQGSRDGNPHGRP